MAYIQEAAYLLTGAEVHESLLIGAEVHESFDTHTHTHTHTHT